MKSKNTLIYSCIIVILGGMVCTMSHEAAAQTKSGSSTTSQEKSEAIESLLSDLHKDGKLNGTVLVSENSKVIYSGAFGYGKLEPKEKLSTDSCFRLGSVSKQFTAMGIMILKEQGKLSFDDDISKHLPGLPYEGITVRHLLVHTSGMPDYMQLFGKKWDKDELAFGEDVLRLLIEHQPKVDFEPGEKYEYSNTGYTLLGCIITSASGMSFSEFMTATIFDVLGMNDSMCSTGAKDQPIKNRVFGYSAKGKNIDYHYLNGILGDGGIYSTIGDMFKWDQGLYTSTLVTKATWEEALTPYTLNDGKVSDYGFGWTLARGDGEDWIQHGGSWAGFSTFIHRDLKRNNSIVVLTNMNGRVGRLVDQIDSILKDEDSQ